MNRRAFNAARRRGSVSARGARAAAGAKGMAPRHSATGAPPEPLVEGMRERLRELGYVEGRAMG
ncbi:MAG TPA: hypothetical protein VKG24_13060 [Pseudolabrys sp.]|nr:hypothetical protein [Pseudolabrys sp.]